MNHHKRGPGRLIYGIVIAVAVVVVIFLVTVIIINLIVLPNIVGRIEERLVRMCHCPASIGSLHYFPGRGLTIGSLTIGNADIGSLNTNDAAPESASSLSLNASSIRIGLSLRFVRGIAGDLEIGWPGIDPWNVKTVFFDSIESITQSAKIPDTFSIDELSATLITPKRERLRLRIDHLYMVHSSRTRLIEIVASTGLNGSAPSMRAKSVLDYEARTISGNIEVADLSPYAGGQLSTIRSGLLRGHLFLDSAEDDRLFFEGNIVLSDFEVFLPSISDETLGDIDLEYAFRGVYDPFEVQTIETSDTGSDDSAMSPDARKGAIRFTDGELRLGLASAGFLPSLYGLFADRSYVDDASKKNAPHVSSDPNDPEVQRSGWDINPGGFELAIRLPQTSVEQLLKSVPDAVAGPIRHTRMRGALDWKFDVTVPFDSISETIWNSEAKLDEFSVQEILSSINPYKLNDAFVFTNDTVGAAYRRTVSIPAARPASMEWMLTHSEHTRKQIEATRATQKQIADSRTPVYTAPVAMPDPDDTYRYVYVDEMSPWIVRAILTAEDGDFFFYPGVNPVTLIDAIEINLRAGEILYGASTISMQLAKVLFLDQQRTFTRKLQEVFLVYLMEHHVPVAKERILELYLNLAEFGPGVFGVYDAADYYFDKHPGNLTAGEATWLASILPAPKIYHRYFTTGALSDEWIPQLIKLYNIMLERGRMTGAEYRQALKEPPVFR